MNRRLCVISFKEFSTLEKEGKGISYYGICQQLSNTELIARQYKNEEKKYLSVGL